MREEGCCRGPPPAELLKLKTAIYTSEERKGYEYYLAKETAKEQTRASKVTSQAQPMLKKLSTKSERQLFFE